MHALVRQWVIDRPDAEALRDPLTGTTLSYAALWERSGWVAAELAERGVGRGAVVAVMLARSANLVVGGEQLELTAVRRVLETAPPGRLVNGYGPTETTTFAAYFDCTAATVTGIDRQDDYLRFTTDWRIPAMFVLVKSMYWMALMGAVNDLIDVRVDDATSEIRDLIAGLSEAPRLIPTVYGYDERGSELYAQICDLETYYPYRTEWTLLTRNVNSICDLANISEIVELGCGTATKSELLLSRVSVKSQAPLRYVPIDVSEEMLRRTSARLADSIDGLEIWPIAGDYHSGLSVVEQQPKASRLFLFMGSSLGNMCEQKRRELLVNIRSAGQCGDLMMIGVDFDKPRSILESAYNDPPECDLWHSFLTNRLTYLNRVFDGDFNPSIFDSRLAYNTDARRVEAQIWPRVDIEFCLADLNLRGVIEAGERVIVDTSHKFKIDELNELLDTAGMRIMESYEEPTVKYSLLLVEMM